MRETIRIETPRLILRTPLPGDAAEVNAAMNRVWHDLQLWMGWAYDGEETMEATERYIAGVPARLAAGDCPFLGFCRLTGRFAVATGIATETGHPATGYWVAHDFLGKGYATEACNAAIRYAFNVMKLDAMHINHYEGNARSARVIEKLGFAKTGIRPAGHLRCSDGTPLDVHEFVMTDPSVLPPLDVRWGPP